MITSNTYKSIDNMVTYISVSIILLFLISHQANARLVAVGFVVDPDNCSTSEFYPGEPVDRSAIITTCEYFSAVDQNDFEKAYSFFADKLKRSISYEDYLSMMNSVLSRTGDDIGSFRQPKVHRALVEQYRPKMNTFTFSFIEEYPKSIIRHEITVQALGPHAEIISYRIGPW
jgi:hypothetical protein